MKCALTLCCVLAATLTLGVSTGQPCTTSATTTAGSASACRPVHTPVVPGASVQSLTEVVPAGTGQVPGEPPIPNVPARCEVTLYLTLCDSVARFGKGAVDHRDLHLCASPLVPVDTFRWSPESGDRVLCDPGG